MKSMKKVLSDVDQLNFCNFWVNGFVLYFSWLCAFLFQLNPLIGPQLDSSLIAFIQAEWENTPVKPVSILQSPQHS